MLDDPVMAADPRNIGLVATTDGVPFFDDQKRGAWPFVLRCANLPDTLSHHMSNTHLHMLSPNEFWELDPLTATIRRTVRAPKSLHPHLSIIVDDLLGAYQKGMSTAHHYYYHYMYINTCRCTGHGCVCPAIPDTTALLSSQNLAAPLDRRQACASGSGRHDGDQVSLVSLQAHACC